MSLIRKVYHQSEIGTYLKCGKLWEFRYVDKIKMPSRPNLTVGSAVDRSVNANMTSKVQGIIASHEEVRAVAADYFDKEATETEWREDENQGEHKDLVVQLADLHFAKVAPLIQPATVQQVFELQMDGDYDVAGAIDITDTNKFVRDTKTSARQSSGNYIVERAFQPAMYTFAYEAIYGEPPAGFIFDILKKPTVKIPAEYEARTGVVTQLDHQWLFDSINAVHKGISAGVALPAAEGAWWCGAKWCSYWSICKGKK